MPNIKSAKKRVVINAKKREINRAGVSEVKTAIKKFNNAIETNSIDAAEKLLPEVFSVLDSAAAKGVIHKNNAANKKSQLAKKLSDVKSGKHVIIIKKDNKTIAAEKAKAAQEARDVAKAEYQKAAAEKKAAKIEAQKAKIEKEAEEAQKAKKAKKEEKPAKKEVVKADKGAVKEAKAAKTEKDTDKEPKAEKVEKPAKKAKKDAE